MSKIVRVLTLLNPAQIVLMKKEMYQTFCLNQNLFSFPDCKHPKDTEIFQCIELVLDSEEDKVVERKRYPGENSIAMVAWRMTMKTPEYPDGNY